MPLKIGILGAAGSAPAAVVRPSRRREDATEVAAVASSRGAPEASAQEHGIARAYASYVLDAVHAAAGMAWPARRTRAGRIGDRSGSRRTLDHRIEARQARTAP